MDYKKAIKLLLSTLIFVLNLFLLNTFISTTFNKNITQLNFDRSYADDFNSDSKQNSPEVIVPKNILGTSDQLLTFNSVNIPILMYHYIRDYNISSDPLGINLSVSPSNFERQMTELQEQHYTSILFKDIIDYTIYNKPLPKNPIVISFDDGYKDQYIEALPILKKHNLIGTFGIITGFVGRNNYMSWDDIKDLKNLGNEIVSHTVNHPNLAQLSNERITYELAQSKKTLDDMLGQNTQSLIYPSGKYNNVVIGIAKSLGYLISRSTEPGRIISPSNLMNMPTVRMFNDTSINSYTTIPKKIELKGSIKCPTYTNTNKINLILNASDNISMTNTIQMQIGEIDNFTATNIPFKPFNSSTEYTLSNVDGLKTIYIRYKNNLGIFSPIYTCTTTLDTKIPELIKDNEIADKNNVTIYIKASEETSANIDFGIDKNYTSNIESSDVSVDHQIYIPNLLPCTIFFYRINIIDKSGNKFSSQDLKFTTKGCVGESFIKKDITGVIKKETGGELSLHDEKSNLTLIVPNNFSKNDLNFQILKMQRDNTLYTTGTPNKHLKLFGYEIYEIKAIKSESEKQSQFTNPIRLRFTFDTSFINNSNMSSASIYRWDDGIWTKLTNCSTNSNDITCDTNNFSIFGLFTSSIDNSQNLITDISNYTESFIIIIIILINFIFREFKYHLTKSKKNINYLKIFK